MKQMVTFEFGYSFLTGRPVWDELASRLPNTVALLGSALFLSALLGTWLGIQAALERGRWLEKIVLWSGAVSFSFPSFFVQLVLLMTFAYAIRFSPCAGAFLFLRPAFWTQVSIYQWHLALPAALWFFSVLADGPLRTILW